MMRDAVRDWWRRSSSRREPAPPGRHVPMSSRRISARWGSSGHPQGLRLRGLDHVATAHHAGAGAGRLGPALVRLGAERLVMYPIHSYGSDAQKDRWLPAAVRRALGCFGLTEPTTAPIRLDEDASGQEGQRVRAERHQALITNGRWPTWRWSGPGRRRRDRRLPGGEGDARLQHARHPRKFSCAPRSPRSSRSRLPHPLENKLPG